MWLRALPGAGKTRLLQDLLSGPLAGRRSRWLVLDDPTPAALREALAAFGRRDGGRQRRLMIASRPDEPGTHALLTPSVYGNVELLDDAALFVTTADCRAADAPMLAATGGWPVLVDAWHSGRIDAIMEMLPDFLEREVLPLLPQPVVVALFGALNAPLPPAAMAHLFGKHKSCHALLAVAEGGLSVAGTWIQNALVRLRARPYVLPPAVRDRIIHLYTVFADPVHSIRSLIDIGQIEEALEVFNRAGGVFFGDLHGYRTLDEILQRFGPECERRTENLFLARLCLMIKSGRSREALLRLEARYPGLPVDLRHLRLSHQPHALLIRLDLSTQLDELPTVEAVTSWSRLEALLPVREEITRGMLYNTMALGFLRADALPQAQRLAEEALAVYERAGSPYLIHYMRLHLCDLALRQSRLRDATLNLRHAEETLRASRLTFNSEPAIIDCFRARIAYEEGRFAECTGDVEAILQALLRGDSWPDLLSGLAHHFVFTEYWQNGLRKALDRLENLSLTLSRRHGPSRHQGLALLRIRLHQLARRPGEAGVLLEEYNLVHAAPHSHRAQIDERLIRLRQLIMGQRQIEEPLQLAAQLAREPGVDARQRVSLEILQAYLRHRGGEAGLARRHLGAALRAAEAGGLLGVLLEDGQFLERLLPLLVAERSPGAARLAAFARRVMGLLRTLPSEPLHSKARAGVSRQEHRVLSYLTERYTNKEIARALILSESAVKFHLRNLFRKLNVTSRAALLDAARQRGIVS